MDVIRHSWKYWKKIWPQVVLVVALALIMMSITLLTPQVSQLIIDKVLYPALGEPIEEQNDSRKSRIESFCFIRRWGSPSKSKTTLSWIFW